MLIKILYSEMKKNINVKLSNGWNLGENQNFEKPEKQF